MFDASSSTQTSTESELASAVESTRSISGRTVIGAMFVFAIVATGALWTYWYYHTQPFIPLQKAIAEAFPGSAPRVDGGQRRMHRGTPELVWIVMKVQFHPIEDKAEAQATFKKVVQLTKKHLDLSPFEQINVRLFRGDPEKVIHRQDFEFPLSEGTGKK